MNYDYFLEQVIEHGIAAAAADYEGRGDFWYEGAVAGFNACRGLDLDGLRKLYQRATDVSIKAYNVRTPHRRYWRIRAFQSEIEWVCNVVSAALEASGRPRILTPTARGAMKAMDILGGEVLA